MIKRKKRIFKKLLCVFLCVGLLGVPNTLVRAEEAAEASAEALAPEHTAYYDQPIETDAIKGWPKGPQIEGEAAVLIDIETGSVLYAKNADKQMYPASITKIMTTLIACEELPDMKAPLIVSQSAAYGIEEVGTSGIYAETDEEFTVEQALMAVMLESANEMTLAVAEEVSGSVKKFVEKMNQRARQLGCINTHFNNTHGLSDEKHFTSAMDMARISRAAWYNPRFRTFVGKQYYEVPPTNKQPETRYFLNHHKMMEGRDYAYEGVMGGKTGYTELAGNTLVTYAKRGKMRLIAVVLNSVNGAWDDTRLLLDYGFDNFEKKCLISDRELEETPLLPCDKYILKEEFTKNAFYYRRSVFVTIPKGADISTLEKRTDILWDVIATKPRRKDSYYMDGHFVGFGILYGRDITSNFFIDPFL